MRCAWARHGAFGSAHSSRGARRCLPTVARAVDTKQVAALGDYVVVEYTASIVPPEEEAAEDVVIDSRTDKDTPKRFHVGRPDADNIPDGVDELVRGLAVGETASALFQPDDAYGNWDDGLLFSVPRDAGEEVQKQDVVSMTSNELTFPAVVVDVGELEVTLDANHPMSGMEVRFDVELTELHKGEDLENITFAAGPFWQAEQAFASLPGVVRTCVGFVNGGSIEPEYSDVVAGETGHALAVQLLFDTTRTDVEALLGAFWEYIERPEVQEAPEGTQMRKGVYCHTDQQHAAADAFLAAMQAEDTSERESLVEVAHLTDFSLAEAFHQQYLERGGNIEVLAPDEEMDEE